MSKKNPSLPRRRHLRRLEAESMRLLCEVVAEFRRPVLLCSVGKESSVLLRLTRRAFYPSPPPFALLHIDTSPHHPEVHAFRDRMAEEADMDLIVHAHHHGGGSAQAAGNGFGRLGAVQAQTLREALERYGFDSVICGFRADEEARWRMMGIRRSEDGAAGVFPLADWTEADVWQLVHEEGLPVAPEYFADSRAVLESDGAWRLAADGEAGEPRRVRCRSLREFPFGFLESDADTPEAVMREVLPPDEAARRFEWREEMDRLNTVVCGDADAGRSTLTACLRDGPEAAAMQNAALGAVERISFATTRRRIMLMDPPDAGHYAEDIAIGAAAAEVAVVVVDAVRGLGGQARRHMLIASLFGIRHMVLAVNRMDRVDWQEARFRDIEEAVREHAAALGVEDLCGLAVCAQDGANVFRRDGVPAWVSGPTLAEALESIDATDESGAKPFRMPVQWVGRGEAGLFGLFGTIAAGAVRPGDRLRACPLRREAVVKRIVTSEGDADEARAGEAVTLMLDEALEAHRGNVLAAAGRVPEDTDQFAAHLWWMHEKPPIPHRQYLMKIGAQAVTFQVTRLHYKLNADTLEHLAPKALQAGDVLHGDFALDQAVAFDPRATVRDTGGFVLLDRFTHELLGAGMIEQGLEHASNLTWHEMEVDRTQRAQQKGQKPCVLWFTGLSGSGKSTTGSRLEARLAEQGRHSYILDGDNVRHGLNRDLGFSDADRVTNVRRVAEVANLFADAGLIVLVSLISPFRAEREMARDIVPDGEFIEIYVEAPLDVCEQRDPKGLYKKARAGEIPHFTGIDSPYEPPENPELVLNTAAHTPDELVDQILAFLQQRGHI